MSGATSEAEHGEQNTDSPGREAQKRKIVEAATEVVVGSTGLTVSLEHLNFEQIVRSAGVPRSTAYRLWEDGREGFYRDLLMELAGPKWFGTAAFDEETIQVATDVVAERLDQLGTLDGRRRALEEAIRLGTRKNFESLLADARWCTYVALNATVLSTPDERLRSTLAEQLSESEKQFINNMVVFYDNMGVILGLRTRETFDYGDLAGAGAAIVEGLALRHILVPELVDRPHKLNGKDEDWSLAAVGFLGVTYQIVEFIEDYDPAAALQEYFKRMSIR